MHSVLIKSRNFRHDIHLQRSWKPYYHIYISLRPRQFLSLAERKPRIQLTTEAINTHSSASHILNLYGMPQILFLDRWKQPTRIWNRSHEKWCIIMAETLTSTRIHSLPVFVKMVIFGHQSHNCHPVHVIWNTLWTLDMSIHPASPWNSLMKMKQRKMFIKINIFSICYALQEKCRGNRVMVSEHILKILTNQNDQYLQSKKPVRSENEREE